MNTESEQANNKMHDLEARLKARFDEIARLTNLYVEGERRIHRMRGMLDAAVAAILDDGNWPFLSQKARMSKKRALLMHTGLFDPIWYLERYTDVEKAGIDPLEHFIMHGYAEGRKPNGDLDTKTGRRRGRKGKR